jgi:hypothetical protein
VNAAGTLGLFASLPDATTVAGRRLAVAPNGNPLIAGEFSGTMQLSSLGDLASAGLTDAFILEMSPSAAVIRRDRLGGTGPDQANDVAVSSTGEIWLAGDFSDTTTGLATLTAAGNPANAKTDAFLLKLSASGTSFVANLSRSFGGDGNDTGRAVVIDASGNVILGGNFEFSVDFDVDPTLAFTLHSSGDRDMYLVKLASDGAFQWARAIGGFRDDLLADLATDAEGNVYSTGEFRDRVDFDPLDGFRDQFRNEPRGVSQQDGQRGPLRVGRATWGPAGRNCTRTRFGCFKQWAGRFCRRIPEHSRLRPDG